MKLSHQMTRAKHRGGRPRALTDEQVDAIRHRYYKEEWSMHRCGEFFGVHHTTIMQVVNQTGAYS